MRRILKRAWIVFVFSALCYGLVVGAVRAGREALGQNTCHMPNVYAGPIAVFFGIFAIATASAAIYELSTGNLSRSEP